MTNIINHVGQAIRRMILATLHLLGNTVGHFLYAFRCCRYYYTHTNINLCFPSLSAREVNRLTRQSLRETGKLFFEAIFFLIFPGKFYRNSIRGVIGEEHLLQARAEGRGVIVVCPHLGNWEAFSDWIGSHGACVSYKPLTSKWMDRRVRYCRECNGSRLLPIGNDGLRSMYMELDKGGIVMFSPDQVPEAGGRLMAPFFNVPAWTGTLVPRLAGKKNVRVICGFARRLPRAQGFEIYLHPAPDEIYSQDLMAAVAALNRGMEECIRRSPEQYTWEYKRFKSGVYEKLYYRAKLLT